MKITSLALNKFAPGKFFVGRGGGVMYSITTTLNSTFGTTGEATADKMTGKVVGKLE